MPRKRRRVETENVSNEEVEVDYSSESSDIDLVVDVVTDPVEDEEQKEKILGRRGGMAKVATNRNHKCNIGGQVYYFVEGEVQTVPKNVKEVLLRAGILAPI